MSVGARSATFAVSQNSPCSVAKAPSSPSTSAGRAAGELEQRRGGARRPREERRTLIRRTGGQPRLVELTNHSVREVALQLAAAGAQHLETPRMRQLVRGDEQPRLPDAGGPVEHEQRPPTFGRVSRASPQRASSSASRSSRVPSPCCVKNLGGFPGLLPIATGLLRPKDMRHNARNALKGESVTATQMVAIPLGRYSVDRLHSHVGFAVKHMVVATFRGEFKDIDATLVSTEDGIRLEGSVPVGSISVDDQDLRAHLLSPEFFDVVRTPDIRFVSDDVRVDDSGAVALYGELTMKGVTRPLQARGTLAGPVVDPYGRERLGLELHATVDRTAYGLSWNMPLPSGGVAVGQRGQADGVPGAAARGRV